MEVQKITENTENTENKSIHNHQNFKSIDTENEPIPKHNHPKRKKNKQKNIYNISFPLGEKKNDRYIGLLKIGMDNC